MGTPSSIPPTSLTPSTGSPRVPSPQSRTKDNAVHAGLSPPPVPSRVLNSLPLELSNPSPSNNSSTATKLTKVATVVSWTTLSNTSRNPHSCSRLTIHTLVPTISGTSANLTLSRMSLRIPPVLTSRLLLPLDQFPSPSRPTNLSSKPIPPVSLPPPSVEPNSITVSSLSV